MRSLPAPASPNPFQRIHQSVSALQGLRTQTRPLDESSAPGIAAPARTSSISKSDSASFSADSQALLDQPEEQNKKVLSLLNQMFGITNVASMSLQIDVTHAHAQQSSSSELQRSDASGITYDYQDSSQQADYTALSATGTITLDDGRSFNLDLQYEHALIVTSDRSLHLEGPASDAPSDLSGTGKRLLDDLFPPEALAKNLSDALRNLTHASQRGSSENSSDTSSNSPASLIASLEVSAMSTQSINAVFSHLRDLKQQRQAESYQPKNASDLAVQTPNLSTII